MGNLQVFGLNIFVLLGGLIVLALGSVVLLAAYVALRVWIFHWLQRRSQKAYLKRTHRADGKRYPPAARGVCDQCGRASNHIYFPPSGPALCDACYEVSWREVETAQRTEARESCTRCSSG